MNNKKLGNDFERRFGKALRLEGFAAVFIPPNRSGAQPFDFVAMKNGNSFAIDCKTCVADRFTLDRVEDNQNLAFKQWEFCGGRPALFAVEHKDNIYMIPWRDVLEHESVRIDGYVTFARWCEFVGVM